MTLVLQQVTITSPMDHPPRSPIISSTGQDNKRRRSSSPSPSSPESDSLAPAIMGGAAAADATPATLVAPPIKKSSLATFLPRDIDGQEGHRLLLPFLTTNDRLRLSECCRDLLPYRCHLSRLKLRPHPSPSPAMKRGLVELLLGEEGGGGLEYLCVGHRSMVHLLDLASWGCFEGLKTLDLSDSDLKAEDAGFVERALLGGGLMNLEELDFSRNESIEEAGVLSIIEALGQGACPRLRRLDLNDTCKYVALGDAMAKALESGHLHYLQDLNLSWSDLSEGGMAAIARALQGGACPQLVRLDISHCELEGEDGEALGMAMRAGGCAKLSLLDHNMMGDQGHMAIFESLEVGSCPNLKRLNLNHAYMSFPAATALGHALLSGSCHRLQALDLSEAFLDPVASLHVLQVIHQGGRGVMPNLLHLDLSANKMGQEHGRLLGEAIGVGAFPTLERLCVSFNNALGDGGVVAVMAGLEGGGCPHLQELKVFKVEMDSQGGQALGRALASGKLSCLQTLSLGENGRVGDEAMREVMVGLKGCHQLRDMDVRRTGMWREAGEVLVQALREGAWPHLRVMDVSHNEDLFVDEEVGRGLVEVVEGSKLQHLESLRLYRSGVRKQVLARILGAIERGACPRLTRIVVSKSSVTEDWMGWVNRLRDRDVDLDRV